MINIFCPGGDKLIKKLKLLIFVCVIISCNTETKKINFKLLVLFSFFFKEKQLLVFDWFQ